MEVKIHGQTLHSFLVEVIDEKGSETFDIHSLLEVDDANLEAEIVHAAANEHWWHQLALSAENDLEEFEKTWYNQYVAHTEKYAAYYLKGQGERNPTGTSKEKCATLLFSSEADQAACAAVAWVGHKETMGKVGLGFMSDVQFREEMYRYEQSMEEIERIRLSMKHRASQLRAIFSAFSTKSWSIKTRAADKRAVVNANM